MIKYNRLSRYTIQKIIKCFCIDVDASKTSKLLCINRNTINRYFNLFREAIFEYQTTQFKKIIGTVEVDESYFGRSRIRGLPGIKLKGRSTNKQPVFGIYERGGRVYTEIIPDCKKPTLQGIIRGKVDLKSIIMSDGWKGYDGLVDVGYDKHFRVNHYKEFSNEECHINGMESFWSYAKRRLSKFNGVKKNFELHLKECEWRHKKNHLNLKHELGIIFFRFLKNLNRY